MSDLVDRQMVLSAIMDTFAKSLAREKAIECVVKVPGVDPTQPNDSNALNALDSISRQEAIKAIDEIESEVANGDGFQYDKWRQYFCDLPSAQSESERKKGKWLDNETSYSDDGVQTCTCSVCGRRSRRPVGDFCKWCGADMREGTKNQITVCPMCPDCPDNCPLGAETKGEADD